MPDYSRLLENENDVNFLLMGRQGTNVDTLLFVNVSESKRKISLISVPRDLWVKGRKINSFYADYGVGEQVRVVQDVLGVKISKYILIDLESFRDIIDMIGGVDIVLEEDLIDPTYRVCDDGVCGSLYYEAGPHHLNGTAALRVARSRYTSSDYARAERQQMIVEAIKDKALSLKMGDASTIVSMISRMISATETNMLPEEALLYYFRYQNFDLSRGNVLSTANVLTSSREPVNYPTSLKTRTCVDENIPETCKDGFAIYTLTPKNGDFNVILWYVRQILL